MISYLLRYLRIIIASLFRPRMSPTDVSKVDFIAWPFDCEMKAVNGARILSLMDNSRLDFVARTGMLKAMIKNRWLIVITAQRVTYFRPIAMFSRFSIEARIVSWSGPWYICECKIFQKNRLM